RAKTDLAPPPAALGEPATDDLLGDALTGLAAVHIGGVEEVDPALHGAVHDDVAVVLGRLGTEVHRAETEPAYRQAGAAKIRVLHGLHPKSVAGKPPVE